MKQQFIKDTADTFKTYIYENNRKLVPSSAEISIFLPASSTKLVDGAEMQIAQDGLLSYSLTAGHNSALGADYKAAISYVHASKTCYAVLYYDVVNSRLVKVITDDDIIAELPQIREFGWQARGEAESGSATTIVDSELKRYEDDHFTGGLAYSADKGETREITAFASSTGTVTTASFSSPVAAGEKYILSRSFSKEIQRAFEKIEAGLMALGRRPHLVLDPYDLREAHIYFSVAEVCKGLVASEEGLWWRMWKEYEKKAEGAFGSLNIKYDASEDGFIASHEVGQTFNNLTMGRR